jgi:hypothetical protein
LGRERSPFLGRAPRALGGGRFHVKTAMRVGAGEMSPPGGASLSPSLRVWTMDHGSGSRARANGGREVAARATSW